MLSMIVPLLLQIVKQVWSVIYFLQHVRMLIIALHNINH